MEEKKIVMPPPPKNLRNMPPPPPPKLEKKEEIQRGTEKIEEKPVEKKVLPPKKSVEKPKEKKRAKEEVAEKKAENVARQGASIQQGQTLEGTKVSNLDENGEQVEVEAKPEVVQQAESSSGLKKAFYWIGFFVCLGAIAGIIFLLLNLK